MINKVFKSTALYAIGSVIPNMASFILLPIYTSHLSTADYGIVNSLQVLSVIVLIIFSLGVERSIPRLYYDYDTDSQRKEFISSIFTMLIIISTVILFLLFLFQDFVQLIYISIDFYPYFYLSLIGTYMSVFGLIPMVYFRVQEKARFFVIISLSQFTLTTILVMYFVVFEKAGAEGMLKGQAIAQSIAAVFFLVFSIKNFGFGIKKEFLKNTLTFSLPMIPSLIGAWVLNLSDRVFIERFMSLSEVGTYSLGYKLASILLIASTAFFSAYNPLFFKLAKENTIKAKALLKAYNNGFVLFVMFLTFNMAFFSKIVIEVFFEPEYYSAINIVSIVALGSMISIVGSLLNLSVYQEKKTLQMMYIQIIGALLNIVLNYFFIKEYGAVGAAWATALSFTVIFIIKYSYALKTYFIQFEWKKITLYGIVFLTLFFVMKTIDVGTHYELIIKGIISFALGWYLYQTNIRALMKDPEFNLF